jgi:hypothetical protein
LLNQIAALHGTAAATPTPPAFPIPLTNVVAWYDGADTSSISVSGTAVTQWNDKSGNSYNVTQSTSGSRPVSGVSTLNGWNVLNFDGTDDYLTAATASNWTFMKSNTKYLICAVVRVGNVSNPDTYYGILNVSGSANTGTNMNPDYRISRTWMRQFQTNSSDNNVYDNVITTFTANTWTSLGSLSDPANGTAANRSLLYKNNGSAIQSNTETNSATTEAPGRPLEIGRYANTAGNMAGSIAEIVILNATGATDGNRTAIRDYFTEKWGV